MTQNKIDLKALDALIQTAAKKVGAKKENDICRYIPSPTGIGYIHHFTMRKMRTEEPEQLQALLNKHIINVDKPMSVSPKPRAARGSRKRRDQLLFSKTDIERLLGMARQTGDSEMIRKLTPKKDLRTIKRELISSIRHGRIEQELWLSYTETLNHHNALIAAGSAPFSN
jgi:hypothetical protein